MNVPTTEYNSNLVFWQGLGTRQARDLVLISENRALIDETDRIFEKCLIVYSGPETDVGEFGKGIVSLPELDRMQGIMFDTIVIEDLVPGQWKQISNFIKRLKLANPQIAIIITGRNRLYDLIRLQRNRRSTYVDRIASDLARISAESFSIYYSRWHIELDEYVEVDITPSSKSHRNVYVPGNPFRSLKSRLLSRPFINRFLPGWVLTNCAAGESLIEKDFNSLLRGLNFGSNNFEISRFITGNASIAIAIMQQSVSSSSFVARLPATEFGKQLCRRNSETLKKIAGYNFSFATPRFIIQDEAERAMYVETLVPGKELSIGSHQSVEITKKAYTIADEVSRASRRVIGWNELIKLRILRYKQKLDLEYHQNLDRLLELLESNVRDCESTIQFPSHGDFKLGNILFRSDISIVGVIDWDCFDEVGLPLFDELTYLVYLYRSIYDQQHFESYLQRILTLQQVDSHLELVTERANALKVGENEYLNFRVLFWFDHVISRYSKRLLEIPLYRKYLVGTPLQKCIEVLEAGLADRGAGE